MFFFFILFFFSCIYLPTYRQFHCVQRGCLFPDELQEDFGGRYKRSDCVVNCRVDSIIALCNCLIFYLPVIETPAKRTSMNIPACTLEHVACLNHYKGNLYAIIKKLIVIIKTFSKMVNIAIKFAKSCWFGERNRRRIILSTMFTILFGYNIQSIW